jgi:P pilus assembly chaperone PapD
VVLVESVLPRTEASGRTLFYALRTGMKLYVQPPGLVADGQVADVAVRDARPDSTGKPAGREAEVVFENTGTRHLVAKGRLEFRRPDNTTAASVELPPAYALPGATARVKAKLPAIAPGKYVILAVLDYGGSELAAAQLEQEVR